MGKLRCFADLHHNALYYSLQLLFEKRLGGTLMRPIGEEWFEEGYFHIAKPYNDYPGTITQFLGIRDEVYMPEDGSPPLNEIKEKTSGYYLVKAPGKDQKAVTLEQFKNTKFDIIIASIPQHLEPYTKLIKEYQPNAKLIYQIGNDFGPINFKLAKNIMSSTMPERVPKGVNVVFYHQEFSLDTFKYVPPVGGKGIYSFVHLLSKRPEDYELYKELKEALSEFEFRSYGTACDDGPVNGWENVAKKMHESAFGFHLKTGGDGFGHIIHNWFAVGRPPIIRGSQYRDKLAGQLMEDGKTCIDLDKGDFERNVELIRQLAKPDFHRGMCQDTYKRFRNVVNFDQEQKGIEVFLGRLR